MSYVPKDVSKSTKPGAGAREELLNQIIVIPHSAISYTPPRDSAGVKMIGNYGFKAGQYVEKIYATSSSIKLTKPSDGDEDGVGFTHGVEFSHPGDELEVNEFIQNRTNVPCSILVGVGSCSNPDYYKVYGSCANPLTLKVESTNDNETTKNMMTWSASVKSQKVPGFYYGTLATDTVRTIAPDTAEPDVAEGTGNYEIDANTAATEITDLQNGISNQIVTLVGTTDANASVINTGGNFLLAGGNSFVATQGESITLKAFESTGGSLIWVEQSRQ